MPSTQLTWKWLAGFFDGEGCIAVCRSNPGQPAHYIRVSISQCGDQAFVLDEIKSFLESYGVKVYRRCGDRGDIQISEFDSVEFILKRLASHLIVKRERAVECLEYMKEVRRLRKKHGFHNWSKFITPPPMLRGVT